MIWFTSDWHFGHKNILNYCKRPFKDLEEMHIALIKLWNDTVKPEDTVYFIGDFSLNKKWSRDIVPLLNGTKYLISGNHDATFAYVGRSSHIKMIETYKTHGWTDVKMKEVLTLKDGRNVLLTHLPYSNTHDSRYPELKPKDEGMFHLIGHLHGHFIKFHNEIDVGYDAHNGKLVTEDEIIQLINDKREFIPSHLTGMHTERSKDETY